MAPVVGPEQRTASEVVAVVRRKLLGYFEAVEERVEDASDRPRRAYQLLAFLYSRRAALSRTAAMVSHSPERVTIIVRDAEMRSLRDPEALSKIEGRMDLIKAWTALLVDSAEQVERENQWGDIYAAVGSGEDEFANASAAEARRRWQSET